MLSPLKFTLKRIGKIFVWFFVITTLGTSGLVLLSGDPNFQPPQDERLINDVTGLNPIEVSQVVTPHSIEDVVLAIKASHGPISIGGGRYSMGGQVAYPDSLHLDMRQFNNIVKLDAAAKEITVQSGITWRSIQEAIDPHELSIRIMQTYSNFTVGGSLSVNVHGRYIGEGPLIRSVKSIKLVLANGDVIEASPSENSELFYGAIGGYGGLGVIVEATLALTDNHRIERHTTAMQIDQYANYFNQNIRNNAGVVFHNADIYPPDFEDVREVSWYKTDKPLTTQDRIITVNTEYGWQPLAAEFVGAFGFGKWLRQHLFDPVYYSTDVVVNRNWEASYDVRELEPTSRRENTFVLREYFVPAEKFDEFVPKMREIFQRHDVNVLNVSIRHALADTGSLLAWAKTETFAFVVYYRQGTDQASRDAVGIWSREMIDVALSVGGSYYLPYQLHETDQQFAQAYPNSARFFDLKKRVDPDYRFRNRLWQHLYPEEQTGINRSQIKGYFRSEDQTYLSIPEWYLVFNPVEYADFLSAGKNPSDFDFFASIEQYWALYDRVRGLTDGRFPPNDEYLTMLNVIGVSTTVEFMWKGLYEGSVGRITAWTSKQQRTPEERIIADAHTAYAQMIFDKAWYEFEFLPWVGRIWAETDFFGANFIRKLERKLFFTAEFSAKAAYASLIGYGAKAAYAPSSGLVHVSGSFQQTPEQLPTGVSLVASESGQSLLSMPRWGGFTTAMPKILAEGFDFSDIAGNTHIAVSILALSDATLPALPGSVIFEDPLIADVTHKRRYQRVPVAELDTLFATVATHPNLLKIEHVFDF